MGCRGQSSRPRAIPCGPWRTCTGAGLVVAGAYYLDGDRIRVHSQLLDAASGAIAVALAPSTGPRSRPSDVVAGVARVVMGAMAVRQNRFVEPGDGAAIRPPAYDAYVEWERGSASEDASSAERHWRRSLQLDPDFAMPRLNLAFWLMSGGPRRNQEADEILRVLENPSVRQTVGSSLERSAPSSGWGGCQRSRR